MTFSELRWPKARQTRLQAFLANLDRAIRWAPVLEKIEPHYPRPGNGRQPVPLESMVRIHLSACMFGANDRQTEELLIDSPALCAFCRLNDSLPRPPDAETIGNFRRRLERAGLGSMIPNYVELELSKQGASIICGKVNEPRWVGRSKDLDSAVESCARQPTESGEAANQE